MARWFRMYEETLDDPKAQRLEPALFKTWINLLCLASRHAGQLPEVSDIAFALRLSDESAGQAVKSLVDCGLLDETEGGLVPHNWRGRQYKSDVSTERVKRFRNTEETASEKNRNVSASVSVSVSESGSSESGKEVARQFELWYAAYPRKQGRGQALKAFRAALAKTDLTTLLDGISKYKRAKPAYADWAMPATWLNGERWLDESYETGTVRPPPAAPKFGPKPFAPVDREALWKPRLDMLAKSGTWMDSWGPKPGEPHCEVPQALLAHSARTEAG